MTIEQAVQKIRSVTGANKSEPVANHLIADLCNAMWDAGHHPRIKAIRSCLPHLHERAIQQGFHAWRASRGFRLKYPRWANPNIAGPEALAKSVSPDIATAPFTWFDPNNDGRWPGLHPRLVGYLVRIENQSLRDVMALYALIKATFGDQALYCRLSTCAVPLRKLMDEQQIERVQDINPDDLLFRVSEGKAGKDLTSTQQSALLGMHLTQVAPRGSMVAKWKTTRERCRNSRPDSRLRGDAASTCSSCGGRKAFDAHVVEVARGGR